MRGGDFDRWDLELRGGLLGKGRILTALEEHGHGHQLVRFGFRPRPTQGAVLLVALFAIAAVAAALAGAFAAASVLGLLLALVLGLTAIECARAAGSAKRAADGLADAVLQADQVARQDAGFATPGEINNRRRESVAEVDMA
jgi:O-antigen biosynthesis protein